MEQESKPPSQVETREQRKARLSVECEAQIALDTEQINQLEIEHGDSNIAVVRCPFTDGLPVLLAVRTPKQIEIQRHRTMISKGSSGAKIDLLAATKALEELGTLCCVYPDRDTLARVVAARPVALSDLGGAAANLAKTSAEVEGKD